MERLVLEDVSVTVHDNIKTLYLHIGIPKTASTWLQEKVFPSLEHLVYLGCPRSCDLFADASANERILAHVFKQSSQIWPGYGDAIFTAMLGDKASWLADSRDVLISEEGMGRQSSRPALFSAHLRALSRVASDWGFRAIKVLFVVRRQDHWLASHHAQMSDRNPKAGQIDFERLVRAVSSPKLDRFGFGMLLDYHCVYTELIDTLGEDNVLVLPYEQLKDDVTNFLYPILHYLGTPAEKIREIHTVAATTVTNASSAQGVWHLRRRPVRMGRRSLFLPGLNRWKAPGTIRLTPDLQQSVSQAYAPSNRALARDSNIDLERYGYFSFHGNS